MVTLLTPTADQPVGVALMERYIRRQTVWGRTPLQWIVVDDGIEAAQLTLGQQYIRRTRNPQATGAESLADNLLAGLAVATGDFLLIIEHDDWYHPTHIERLLQQLEGAEGVLLAGDRPQRYYNVARRVWRTFPNIGACLCQTGMTAAVIPIFQQAIERCRARGSYGIDGALWGTITRAHWNLQLNYSVVGIKGLPGRPGLGVGHRPDYHWQADPSLAKLREWIGDDAVHYAPFGLAQP